MFCKEISRKVLANAAENRQVDVVRVLLDSGMELDLQVLTNALELACSSGNEEFMQLLLQCDVDGLLGIQQYSDGLCQAARHGNSPLVMYWLQKHPEGQNLTVDPATVLQVAENGFEDILPHLIPRIQSLDSLGVTLSQSLRAAAYHGHHKVVEYLLGEPVDLNAAVDLIPANKPDFSTFQDIILRQGEKLVRLTPLQATIDGLDPIRQRCLVYPGSRREARRTVTASAPSHVNIVEMLLKSGADPNKFGPDTEHPLLMAVAFANSEVVRILISYGADLKATMNRSIVFIPRNRSGVQETVTVLRAAASQEIGSYAIVKALLERSTLSDDVFEMTTALGDALSFFGSSSENSFHLHKSGKFKYSKNLEDVLNTGPGAVIQLLFEALPDATVQDPRYGLLAQMACVVGDEHYVELLLKRGLDVNSLGYYYGTALQAASHFGNSSIVDRLLASNADVNVFGGVYGTALRAAVIGNHGVVVGQLLGSGADVNMRPTDEGESVLRLALEHSDHSMMRRIIEAGAEINSVRFKDEPVLLTACERGDTDLTKMLLAAGANVNISPADMDPRSVDDRKDGWRATPLSIACANGHVAIVQLLLDFGADIELSGGFSSTPLIAAVRGNNLPVVRLLLLRGADVEHTIDDCRRVFTSMPFPQPARMENIEVFAVSPLSQAAQMGNIEILGELLRAGAITSGVSNTVNALTQACKKQQHLAVELLLENLRGSRYRLETCNEALSAAKDVGADGIARRLIEEGANPTGETLQHARSKEKVKAMELLLDSVVEANEAN